MSYMYTRNGLQMNGRNACQSTHQQVCRQSQIESHRITSDPISVCTAWLAALPCLALPMLQSTCTPHLHDRPTDLPLNRQTTRSRRLKKLAQADKQPGAKLYNHPHTDMDTQTQTQTHNPFTALSITLQHTHKCCLSLPPHHTDRDSQRDARR